LKSVKPVGLVPAVGVPETVSVPHTRRSFAVLVVIDPQFKLFDPLPDVAEGEVLEKASHLCGPLYSMNTPPTKLHEVVQSEEVGCPVMEPPTLTAIE
jgi:hypothetical protein